MTGTNAMNGCAASSPISRAKWEAWVERIVCHRRAWRRHAARHACLCRRSLGSRKQADELGRRPRDSILAEALIRRAAEAYGWPPTEFVSLLSRSEGSAAK